MLTPPANPPGHVSNSDELQIGEVIRLIERSIHNCWRSRGVFVKVWAVTIPVGLLFAFGSTPEYIASTRLLPYRSNKMSVNSTIIGLAGITIPGDAGGQVITADLYPEVANSFAFRKRLATTTLYFRDTTRTYQAYFQTAYQRSAVELVERYTVGLPRRVFASLRARPTDVTPLTQAYTQGDSLAAYPDSFITLVNTLQARVTTVMDKKTSIITIRASMPDPVAAADLARLTASGLTTEIIAYESRRASEQAHFLAGQQAQAEQRYLAAQRALAVFQDRNRSLASAVSQIESQRLQYEYSLAFEVYKNLSSQLATARVKEREDTPVLTVLDPSVIPNSASSPPKTLYLLVSVLIGALLATGYVLGRPLVELLRRGTVYPIADAALGEHRTTQR